MAEISRQVRRAQERQHAKVDAAHERVTDRQATRRAKGLQPLARGVVNNPYPPSTHRGFRSPGKDWKAIAAEAERTKHSGYIPRAARKMKTAALGAMAAIVMAGA